MTRRWPTPKEILQQQDEGEWERLNPNEGKQPASGDIFFVNHLENITEQEQEDLLKLLTVIGLSPSEYVLARNDVDRGHFLHKSSMFKPSSAQSKAVALTKSVCVVFLV